MKKGHTLCAATLCLASLTIASAFLLSSSRTNATSTSSSANATVRVSSACTLNGIVNTAHEITLSNGNYSGASGFGQTTLKAFCNDAGGFAIYAIGYTNEEYGNNTLHWNKAASASDNTNAINTGVYTSGTTVDSTWSMKLNALSGTYAATIDDGVSAHNNSTENFATWHAVPTEYKRVAYRLSGTDVEVNGSGTGSSITTTYDTFVSATQPAGTYVGKVKYTLVHPGTSGAPVRPLDPTDCPSNSICYAPNTSDIIGSMSSLGSVTASATAGRQSKTNGISSYNITSSTTEIELIAPNYARSGYGFAGWSTDFEADNNSTIYGPNETITITAGSLSSNGMILYPVWIASAGDMQEWTGCSGLTAATYNSTTGKVSATLNQLTALTDTRDDNVYTVTKLADGQCWMIENLRLDSDYTTSSADIAKAQGYGQSTTYGNFIGLANSEDNHFDNTIPTSANNATNGIYSSDGSTSINIGSSKYPASRIPRYNNNNNKMFNNATNSVGTTLVDNHNANDNYSRWYGYGNYYTWAAAMANTGYYSTYGNAGDSEVAGTSICPKGWQLPLGQESNGTNRIGGFSYLDIIMGGTGRQNDNYSTYTGTTQSIKWRSFPNNFIKSGYYAGANLYSGGGGRYWTRSATDTDESAFDLRLYPANLDAGVEYYSRYYAVSVRCISI